MDRLSVIQDLQKTLVSYEYFGASASERSKTEDELSKQLELLNQEVNWVDKVGSIESFLDSIMRFEDDFSYQEGIDKKKVLQIVMDELKAKSKAVLEKPDLWEYCSEENFAIVIDLQNEKLEYLIESFKMIGIYCEGVSNIQELVNNDYQLIELRNLNTSVTHLTEAEKRSYKLKLAILYRLGVVEHLQKFESLRNNDSTMSRVLASFMGGKRNTYQPYLSAAKNNPRSSSSQNNPLSDKLTEEVESILTRAGINLDDLEG